MWEKIQNLLIILLSLAVLTAAVYKFILKKDNPALATLENPETITIQDLNNMPLNLNTLIHPSADTWIFLLKIDDCHS